jgi:hypothetical protein
MMLLYTITEGSCHLKHFMIQNELHSRNCASDQHNYHRRSRSLA